ncbi:MAG: 6-phospho-3-hexuloisomerase [Kiritimatiellae bacterium]|nr:6-phospho-3-hexuloisomerase [Verrucomicrobiota bacterium]MBU4367056.1 6-phospho-3-hexuloisomerase [Verrucomicrobiota bacterium]MCG2659440.1 6-phospho-3-hexuloisomerase [Kiritimatiellia bacterium]
MNDWTQTTAVITCELQACLGRIAPAEVDALLTALDCAPRIFTAGAGRSGLAMRALAMRLVHLGLTVHVVGDTTTIGIAAGDLLLIGSGSGGTASLVAAATKAKQLGAKVALVTIVPASPIGLVAEVVVRIPAPSPKADETSDAVASAQPMGALFEQCLWLLGDGIIMRLMARRGTTSEAMFKRHANLE